MMVGGLPAFELRLAVVASLLLNLGCGSQPKELLHPVKGKITLDGKPLPRGSVSLRGVLGATAGHQPTGMIEPAGEFVVYTNGQAGAPPGNYRVVVFATEDTVSPDGSARPGLPKSLIPNRYNDPDQSSLTLKVVAQPGPKTYDLELKSDEK